jgi:methionyl-tRNA formyltransferase
MPLKLAMVGTGTFALPTFRSLYDSPHTVVGLVTQPDRTGRGHHQHPHPMKELALERGTPVLQPENANGAVALEQLRELGADLCVVAAYGQILSAGFLEVSPLGAINVHASLLPRYRGAAPIAWAILQGESETGLSIFQIRPRLDAGPVLGIVRTPIGPKETAGDLEERLAVLAPELTLRVIEELSAGTVRPVAQDPALVTRAPKLTREQAAIDWGKDSVEIERHIRAMQPWPKPFTFLLQPGREPLRLLVLDVNPVEGDQSRGCPGEVLLANRELLVRSGDGAVRVEQLQPAGKRVMTADEFLRGHAVREGDRLTTQLDQHS